jgi:hypothetical protein
MERNALGAHERDELGISPATASAGDRRAGSNAGGGSLHRVPRVSGTARGGRGKSGRRTDTQGDHPRYVLGRLGDGHDRRNRRGVRETDLSTRVRYVAIDGERPRLSAWLNGKYVPRSYL